VPIAILLEPVAAVITCMLIFDEVAFDTSDKLLAADKNPAPLT